MRSAVTDAAAWAIVDVMVPRVEHPLIVHRRREREGEPVNDRRLRRLVDSGEVIRVVAGSFVTRVDWAALVPIDRHYVRVLEASARATGTLVVSHFAAAAIWGIDILGAWPATVDVRIERRTGGRSSGAFRRRAIGVDGIELVPWGRHWVTSPAQTAVDLSAASSFTGGVVALDQALWARRLGGPLTSGSAVSSAAESVRGAGAAKVARAAEFATSLSDSVRETQSRVLMNALGFPRPTLQREFVLPSGRIARPDFSFDDHDHVAEFDGIGKYIDPVLLRGRTPEQALIDEKDRADELLRVVGRLSRWRTRALEEPRLLFDILAGAGLPTARSRPRAGQRWS